MTSPTPPILILYGSQTGNSQAAAEALSSEILPQHFPSTKFLPMTLDDFLEYHLSEWTPLVIIVTSSYGVGQAPLGAHLFRSFCDDILSSDDGPKILKGIKYALLGLGDTKYTTYFHNPTAVDRALTKAGAVRFGTLGEADASGVGENAQEKVVDRWMDGLIGFLRKEVDGLSPGEEKDAQLESAQEETLVICERISPEFRPRKVSEEKRRRYDGSLIAVLVPIWGYAEVKLMHCPMKDLVRIGMLFLISVVWVLGQFKIL